jgi:adenylate cyclase class 2
VTGPIESEIKLRVPSVEAAQKKLARLGAKLLAPRHFEDNVLWDDAYRSLSTGGKLLRLRRTPRGAVLTYKGPRTVDEGIKSRPELEAPVAEPDRFEAILGALGFKPVFRYQKYREAYVLGGAAVVIDETPVGVFYEVEGEPDVIRSTASALGYEPGDFISESYGALFSASGGRGDMVFV